ncbi:MAG: hypothetical protein RBR82_04310 [Pseudomonas sp.]|nr:hypothetical protein [Pseudomonas sp.]
MLLLKSSGWRYLAMISIAWLALFTVIRVVLLCASFSVADANVWQLFLFSGLISTLFYGLLYRHSGSDKGELIAQVAR